ncbi:MAG: aminomethyl-transferring glycine dehydrogenase subunit GcvPB, partial [Vicinamibacteria bacterium]
MKYNPKVNEDAARLSGFARSHPAQPQSISQGILRLVHRLEQALLEITGMNRVTFQPAAGAQGELTGMLMIRAYHESRGASGLKRRHVIIPDTAHGTNPASTAICGYEVISVPSGSDGYIRRDEIERVMSERVAAIMLTNPNTLGFFEEDILGIAEVVHARGGLVYCDGANLNAFMGRTRIGDMGVDIFHMNLHKTFSTPHGGGGPGAGPVAVQKMLVPFLPVPTVERDGANFFLDYDRPQSIGKVRSYFGNIGMLVRAYAYIRSLGGEGVRRACDLAVLNANYLVARLRGRYHLPFARRVMHEGVFSDRYQQRFGVKAIDVAKRLMDYGFHPPTVY